MDFINYIDYSFDTISFLKKWKQDIYVNIATAEIKYPIILKEDSLSFMICRTNKGNEYLKMKGSIHKYWNYINGNVDQFGKGHNHNDFSRTDLICALDHLRKKYGLDLNSGHINVLEYGLNINTIHCPSLIINQYTFLYKEKAHCKYYNDHEITYKEFSTTSFNKKIYSKSKQYGLNIHILRCEIKHRNRRQLKSFGIFNLLDLTKIEIWGSLFKHLLEQMHSTTIIDNVDAFDRFSKKDLYYFNIFTSGQNLSKQRKTISRPAIKKRKIRFNEVLVKHNLLNTKDEIIINLISKFKDLVNENHKIIKTK